MDILSRHCEKLASPSSLNFALSIFILVGILVSYLPQHFRIISLKSSFGLSPYFVLLGTTSTTSSLANILVLPRSIEDASCCREISGASCFAALLGILQVGIQWFCFFIILILFVTYFPRATSATSPETSEVRAPIIKDDETPTYRSALAVAGLCLLHALTIFIISLVFAVRHPSSLQSWANFLGILAATLSSIQYFPQIYTTLRIRRVGSLSIPMMCIQTPGSFVFAASLAARLGKEGWSSWGVFIVTACFQGTLLVMAVYFEYFGPERKEAQLRDLYGQLDADAGGGGGGGAAAGDEDRLEVRNQNEPEAQPAEDTPLLQRQ